MRRNESSRFVQTLIREEPRPPATSSSAESASPMPAGAVSRLISAMGVRPATDTVIMNTTATRPLTAPESESSSSGSYEVGEEPVSHTPSPMSPADRLATLVSATRSASRSPSKSMDESDALKEIRSAQKLSVSLPLASSTPAASSASQPIRNDAHPDRSGGLRFASGVDEIFDHRQHESP